MSDEVTFSLATMPPEALAEDGSLLDPAAVPLSALMDSAALVTFAESLAELTQIECSVLLHDPERPRPATAEHRVQIVRAPICQSLSALDGTGRWRCLADVHAAAHEAMQAGTAVTTDCVGGTDLLYACPIYLMHRARRYPKAAVVAAAHDVFNFHFADRLAETIGCSVAEAEDLMCQTDRRCLDAAQLRRLRVIMDVQTQSFSRQITGRYAELESVATIVAQKEELAEAYERLDQEFRVVGQIQRGLVPQSLPTIEGFAVAAYYDPALRAGGDYYDFFGLPSGAWCFLIADVSGHGPAAAVVMAMMRAVLHAFTGDRAEVEEVVAHANRQLCSSIMSDQFVTAFFGVLAPGGERLRVVSAGHNPPLLFDAKARTARELTLVSNFPLGVSQDVEFEVTELSLGPGDVLLLHTDGTVEGRDPSAQEFGVERLCGALQMTAELGAEAVCEGVVQQFREFTAGSPPLDDRTLVVLQKLPE